MRCLGRLVLLVILLSAAVGAWAYRDDLHRWIDRTLHPAAAAARVGHLSAEGVTSAMDKLGALQRAEQDSVVLTADEMASLFARGAGFLPGATADSMSLELGNRTVRIRTVIDSARIPATLRALIPGDTSAFEAVVARGTLTPVRAGLAELTLQHVSLHGVPLPGELIGRLAMQVTGRGSSGRVDVTLPSMIGGFRVRPEGVVVYRQGVPK